MLANGTGKAIVKTGGDTWFFLTADYAFGHALERDTTAVGRSKTGGKVLGSVRHPLNTTDFSSFLLQAQASKAKIIGLANAGGDTINSIKQGAEFGIVKGGQKLRRPAGLRHRRPRARPADRAGPDPDRDLLLGHERRQPRLDQALAGGRNAPGKFPTMVQAGVYSAVTHYLKAVAALKSAADGKAVVAKMKEMPTDDPLFGKGIDPRRRPQDPPGLSVRGEEAGGVEISRRLLQAARHHPGGRGLPSAQGRQLPAGRAAEPTCHHRAAARCARRVPVSRSGRTACFLS